jgi:hypothetical protein
VVPRGTPFSWRSLGLGEELALQPEAQLLPRRIYFRGGLKSWRPGASFQEKREQLDCYRRAKNPATAFNSLCMRRTSVRQKFMLPRWRRASNFFSGINNRERHERDATHKASTADDANNADFLWNSPHQTGAALNQYSPIVSPAVAVTRRAMVRMGMLELTKRTEPSQMQTFVPAG